MPFNNMRFFLVWFLCCGLMPLWCSDEDPMDACTPAQSFDFSNLLDACGEAQDAPTKAKPLLILVYDAVQRHGINITDQDILSFAAQNGFRGVSIFDYTGLCSTVSWYKSILAITGYIDLWDDASLCRQKFLYSTVQENKGWQTLEAYQQVPALKNLTSEDMVAVRGAEWVFATNDPLDFKQYVEEQKIKS